MFRRREQRSTAHHLRNFIWPAIGWRRSASYFRHRVGRLPGSSYSIAAGFAFGAAISFTPFIGFHLAGAAILAWVFRANIVASAIGTLVGNPWTFPFIWIWIYELGRWMGMGGVGADGQIEFAVIFGNIVKALLRFDLVYLQESAWPIFGPMLVGSIPTAIAAWFASYFLIRYLINTYRRARILRLQHKYEAIKKAQTKAEMEKHMVEKQLEKHA